MLAAKGMRFPIDVILVCLRWYAAYPMSYRHLEEMMQERGVLVDHSSINRWAIPFLPAKRDKAAAMRFFDKAMPNFKSVQSAKCVLTGIRPRQNHVHQWLTRQNRRSVVLE